MDYRPYFKKHQKILLKIANTQAGRLLLGIKSLKPVIKIVPCGYHLLIDITDKPIIEATLFTRQVFPPLLIPLVEKLLIYQGEVQEGAILHFADIERNTKYFPTIYLNSLTVNPDTGNPGAVTVDENIANSNANYATCQGSANGTAGSNVQDDYCGRNQLFAASFNITRGFFHFDTSSLGGTASISAAMLSIYGSGVNDADTDSMQIYQSTITSNTTVANGDFGNAGTTAFATAIAFASWATTAYNDFTLNASGITNISLTGVSKFCSRTTKDVGVAQPSGVTNAACKWADSGSNKPKLVVTYTTGGAWLGKYIGA